MDREKLPILKKKAQPSGDVNDPTSMPRWALGGRHQVKFRMLIVPVEPAAKPLSLA
jgi:hypothetical protein